MDRRTFVMTGAWLATTGCTLPWTADAARPARALAVFDPTLAHGRALADYAARGNLLKFEVGDDIGALWHTTLARHLTHRPVVLLGVTRASDYFVLGQLVPRTAHVTHDLSQSNGHTAVRFSIACPLADAPARNGT